MPPLAAVGAAVAGAVSAGVGAVAGAIGISATALATGFTVVGTGLSLVGQLTGNKTLSKIGLGFGAAGGVAGLSLAATNAASNAATVSGATGSATKLLGRDNIDETLSVTTKGAKTIDDLKKFNSAGIETSSMDNFIQASNEINAPGSIQNQEQLSFLERANGTLKKYDTTANVLMGMGNAYMNTRGIQAQEDINKRNLQFDRDQVERRERNFGAPTSSVSAPGLRRVPGAVTTNSLLRRP